MAANYVYSAVKPDGLSFAVVNAGLYFDQLQKRTRGAIRLGQICLDRQHHTRRCVALHVGRRAVQDNPGCPQRPTPPKCGSTGTGNTGYYLPKLIEETIGAKFNIVAGYQGGAEIEFAVERGEVQCRAISIPVYFGREPYYHLAAERTGAYLDPNREKTRC